jgi:hypothetical protein
MLQLPKLGERFYLLPLPILDGLRKPWVYNGEHFWNIGNKGYPAKRIESEIYAENFIIFRQFRVFEMSWHRFYILSVN